MSSRALRRLHGELDLLNSIPGAEGDDDENTEEVEEEKNENLMNQKKNRKKQKKKQVANPFELLADEGQDGDGEPEPAEEEEREEAENKPSPAPKASKKKKKKKKKDKEAAAAAMQQSNGENVEDEIEAGIAEVQRILGVSDLGAGAAPQSESSKHDSLCHALLGIEYRHLNAENELRRRFGSRVVQESHSRQRNRGRVYQRNSKLVQPKDNWPIPGRTGLSMTLLETRGGSQYFAFEHNPFYQKVQFRFLDAVESLHPQNISDLLHEHPYHTDGLIQLSEVFRISEDMQTAADLIVRALYGCEAAFHPLFNLAAGTCRLDYRRPENRSFYICLFKHLQSVGQRACYRTALEFCKLLLSLDPEEDPLCVLLMIDFYALRAEEYGFLIRLFHEWESYRNLSQLPNFAFSVALAMFHSAQGRAAEESQATAMLEDSLLMFPGLLMEMLDKCGVQPDPEVASHAFFGPAAQAKQSEALRQLVALYVGRCFPCWKEPDALRWLEETVHRVLKLVDAKDPRVEDYRKKRSMRYQGTPRNIHRHIILSEIKDATAALPPDMAHAPVLSYDPLPPTDSIISYSRPTRPNAASQSSNAFSLFLRSLLPNYNPNAHLGEEGEVVGAEGGEEDGNAGDNLRRGVAILMDTMRDLLNNIRPVDPPVENQHQGEGREEEEQDWNEEDD